jgi:hypothetical protein
LTEAFEEISLKETSVGQFVLHEFNLMINKATFHPAARNDEERLEERFNWVKSGKTLTWFELCFIDEASFDSNKRPSTARSARGTPSVVITPTTKAVSHTILGAISAMGVVKIELRIPLTPNKKKSC